MGAKVFGVGPRQLVNYVIVLIEKESGLIAGMVDGATITEFRTAATSALAVSRLAPQGPLRLGVLGSGDEARGHVAAIATVRSISEMKVFSPTQAKREAFATYFTNQLGVPCSAATSAEDAADGVDILIAAARARAEIPILHGHMLRRGMMAISIGSTMPEQREADASAIAACDLIVCDAVDEVLDETGDMIEARHAGIDVISKTVSLNDIVSGRCQERANAAQLPMYKSVGNALQDMVVAELSFVKAQQAGCSTSLPIGFYVKRAGKNIVEPINVALV